MRSRINYKYFKKYKTYADFLLKGIYAGFMIGVGAIAFLSVDNKVLGSFLFSIGLLTVCMYGMNLYTGKIGYIINSKKDYYKEVIFGLIGNLIGSLIVGNIAILTRNKEAIVSKAINICNLKLNDNLLSIFVLSAFCGIMIHIAVNNYKKINTEIGKYAGIFMCVMVFILCGFEHSIANMTYFTIAGLWSFKTLLYELIMILGNAVGALFVSWFYNLYYK